MVPSDRLVAPTASGMIDLPNPDSVTVDVLEKLAKLPPGMISGVSVKAEVTLVFKGSTCLFWLTVGVAPVAV